MAGKEELEKRVYDAEEVQQLLGVGRNKIYDYLDEVYADKGPFPVIKIGKLYRIPKEPFDRWLDGKEG
jgi:excisionase family DNA binding protein